MFIGMFVWVSFGAYVCLYVYAYVIRLTLFYGESDLLLLAIGCTDKNHFKDNSQTFLKFLNNYLAHVTMILTRKIYTTTTTTTTTTTNNH